MKNIHNIFSDILNVYKRLDYTVLEDSDLSETTHKYLIRIYLIKQVNKYFTVELLHFKDTDGVVGLLMEDNIRSESVSRFMDDLIDAC